MSHCFSFILTIYALPQDPVELFRDGEWTAGHVLALRSDDYLLRMVKVSPRINTTYSAVIYSTLLYSTLLYSTLIYPTLLYSTLLCLIQSDSTAIILNTVLFLTIGRTFRGRYWRPCVGVCGGRPSRPSGDSS
jgi:hypothetical protein